MRKLKGRIAALAWCGVVALSAGVVFAGCGSSSDNGGSGEALSKIDTAAAKQEGEVNLVNWAGYVEDSTDYGPKYDWVTPFEKQTGCNVNYKEAGTSDQMVDLMRTGQYDGVSASGNASGRLVAGGDVDPVNVDLIDNYKDVFPDLKDQPYNTFDGTHYGVPHGRGANLLMWNSDVV
jgi:putative spermidine/putrescine transport system substrate-binding protein